MELDYSSCFKSHDQELIFILWDEQRDKLRMGKHRILLLLLEKMFLLVGAGGAGKALAFGAKSRGPRVFIFNRNFGSRYYFIQLRLICNCSVLAYWLVISVVSK